ncbi:MAG: hypothetical protein CMO66_04915 [Verrucomicrobiales bacterium]|nr:hypothetical protein [Verrucomicrobiales bacterium]
MPFPKIVSGGQTGADRAALDWALANGIQHNGWCPSGRLAEDGPIAARYHLKETPNTTYIQRTEWNIRDSDATVIISQSPTLTGGSLATLELANTLRKPCLHLHGNQSIAKNAHALREFIEKTQSTTLNIAGPRASGEPAITALVTAILDAACE